MPSNKIQSDKKGKFANVRDCLEKAVMLVNLFLVLKVVFFKINERVTSRKEKKEKKKIKKKERDRGEWKRLGKGKRKTQEKKEKKYIT